jgi:hypothetical protein
VQAIQHTTHDRFEIHLGKRTPILPVLNFISHRANKR